VIKILKILDPHHILSFEYVCNCSCRYEVTECRIALFQNDVNYKQDIFVQNSIKWTHNVEVVSIRLYVIPPKLLNGCI
jgi:hypothetical protein